MPKLAHLNRDSHRIFQRILSHIPANRHATKLDNAPGAYMALCVEFIDDERRFVSFAHYGEQNGDAMRDPDVIFWIDDSGHAVPFAYRNDYMGIDREYVIFENGRPSRFAPSFQRDLKNFCNTWMENLRDQQGI